MCTGEMEVLGWVRQIELSFRCHVFIQDNLRLDLDEPFCRRSHIAYKCLHKVLARSR